MMSDIESVDYLQTGFDPSSLTVPRLRSILVTHNVQYPSTAKKTQLVELFNEQVVPQSKKYLAARARAKRTSKGIVDADSQSIVSTEDLDLMMPRPIPSTRVRSPRKSTRVKRESENPDPVPSLPVPWESPRKRQSRSASAQVVAASDTETGPDADGSLSVKKYPHATPNVKLEATEEDNFFKRTPETENVFTSDNPFQSGGSSPPPVKTPTNRRKTTGLEAVKPKAPSTNRRRTDGPAIEDKSGSRISRSIEIPLPVKRSSTPPKTPEPSVVDAGEEFTPEAQLELMQEEAANPERAILARKKLQPPDQRKGSMTTPLWVLAVTLFGAYAAWYRQEKIAVGYCGLGRPATQIIPDNVQLPEWATVLAEPQCEPCPQHAYCYEDFSVRCEPDFIMKPHPLSFGGLVPVPPTCEPDGEKVRRVQAVADRAIEELRDRRAKFECGEPVAEDGPPLETPSLEEEELKTTISQKRSKRMSKEEFDDLWQAAIGEIKARDEVQVVEEAPNKTGNSGSFPTTRLSSTSLARLPLTCAIRRSIKLGLARHRLSIGGLILTVLSALYGKKRYRDYRVASAQIPGLVDLVLERLAAQKELAFEDGSDDAFLFLPNLRDDVLRSRHSLAERERIWQRVRAVVEQNSNVRTGQREGRNGEVGRAWEWIGPSSAGTGEGSARRRKSGRVSWGPDVKGALGGSEQASEPPEMKAIHRSWEEGGRPYY